MNCDIAHDLLQQSLDGTPIESAEWLGHLRECADCRALASAGRRLQEGLPLLASPRPPSDLAVRVAEAIWLDRRRERRRMRRRWAVGLAVAAGLLLALMLRHEWAKPRIDGTVVSPVVHVDQPPAGLSKEPTTLRESAVQIGEVFASLTSQTADETMGQTRQLVPDVPSPSLPAVDLTAIETPTRPLREAGEGVTEGLEPVTTSARRAVDLFLRDLPPMQTEQQN
jgi:hypothetical protein